MGAGDAGFEKGRTGEKRMNKAATAKSAKEPQLGEAAVQEAFGIKSDTTDSSGVATGVQERSNAWAEPARRTSQVLGEITWLMTQSPRHKAIPLGDLEWLVMPAILLKQFRIFYKGEQPVGVALWALTDEIVAKRIDAGDNRLTAVEWKSGANMRIVDVVAPFGGEAEIREQIRAVC